MSRAAKVVLVSVALVVLLVAAAGILFWKRPIAVLAWWGRCRLVAAGCSKHQVESAVGLQSVFRGGSGPVVVLLHGAGDQAGTWASVAPSLAKRFTLVVPDLAGHGESAPARGPLPFGVLLQGLDGVLAREAPAGKVTLVGNSLGAWVATVWANEHQERVQHLVLVNGGPLLGDRPDLTLQPKNRAEADRTLEALRDPSSPMVPDFVVDDIIRVAATGPLGRLAAESKSMSAYLLDGKLSGFDVPVDLLWGASDKLVSISYAERLATQLPAARLTAIDRCGHAPQVECADRFRETLLKVLEDPLQAPTVSAPPVAAPVHAAAQTP